MLPKDHLTLLVGTYAQVHYLPRTAPKTLTERVQAFHSFGPNLFPLPHPAWRSVLWAKRNPWFDAEVLPALQAAVRARLG